MNWVSFAIGFIWGMAVLASVINILLWIKNKRNKVKL
jgi:hypothetical protein